MTGSEIEFAAAAASAALVAVYYVILWRISRRHPLRTTLGQHRLARNAWIGVIVAEKQDILAVQTLRNWSTAASFLASAAILMSLGVLNAAINTEKAATFAQALDFMGSAGGSVWVIKLLILFANLIISFFCFSLTIRAYNHIGFMISLARSPDYPLSAAQIGTELNHGGALYAWGMRSTYLTVPLVMWLFGPLGIVLGTTLMLVALYFVDYPRHRQGPNGPAAGPTPQNP